MLFLDLENQVFLVITLIFSSYLCLGSLFYRSENTGIKAFGLAFFMPLLLSVCSFLSASHFKAPAEALLFLSQLCLVLVCTAVLLLEQKSDVLKLFIPIPFIVAVILVFTSRTGIYEGLAGILPILLGCLLLLHLTLITLSLIRKEKQRLLPFTGLFLITCALLTWILPGEITFASVLFVATGYGVCSCYFYQQTFVTFYKEHFENKAALMRMNNSLQLEVIRRVEEIERSNRRLLEISKTDSMTGLYIKSALLANLENTIERAPQAVFSLLMFDIDKFKTINDTMGHQVGDRCIKNIAALAQGSFRNEDILARYGGDEFIILLPSTPPVKAFIIADRFRQTIEKQANPKITISVGVSSYPADGQTPAALIEAADKALYASKQKGRNQVTLYSSLVSAVEDKAKVQDHDNERH